MVKLNSKFDPPLVLVKTGLKLLFADVLGRNKGFPDLKTSILHSCHISKFSKGVNPWFNLKI